MAVKGQNTSLAPNNHLYGVILDDDSFDPLLQESLAVGDRERLPSGEHGVDVDGWAGALGHLASAVELSEMPPELLDASLSAGGPPHCLNKSTLRTLGPGVPLLSKARAVRGRSRGAGGQ